MMCFYPDLKFLLLCRGVCLNGEGNLIRFINNKQYVFLIMILPNKAFS